MKFLAAVAVAAIAAVANAQQIQINNPTEGTTWTVGDKGYISWTGNCASQGKNATAVGIELVNGPSSAVRFAAEVGKLDCSGPVLSLFVTVPDVPSGPYSLRVLTTPQPSYSTPFQINNAAKPVTTSPPGLAPTNQPSAANSLASSALAALFGCAAAAVQFAL
ncbi:MAG: hypothetical protein J3Q66DRAFT_342407 [Benniella sp.]|nr:MAG: hypothetical protein J3Q66DRAFT_342407 [Benniella sp.]